MAKFVSLSILVCAKFPERIQMLHQWIQTANELRGFMGNMYGFAAVMAGIRTQQVGGLTHWHLGDRDAILKLQFLILFY